MYNNKYGWVIWRTRSPSGVSFLSLTPWSQFVRKNFFDNFNLMCLCIDEFFEVAIESRPEWDLNPRPLNSVHLTDWATRPWVQFALRANFVQISSLVQCHISFRLFAFVCRHVYVNIYIYIYICMYIYIYVCIYIYIYILSWKQCALPVSTTMALWQLMPLLFLLLVIVITLILLLRDLSALYVLDPLWPQTNILLCTHHSKESRERAGHLYPALLFPPVQENS